MAFQSEFADDAKLNACAVNDSDHIGEQFASRGPWVVLIKKALNAWAAKQNPPVGQIPVNDLFGRETGDLVALYKTRQTPPILNYAGKIDRIVGKKTVAALDRELPPRGVTPASADPKTTAETVAKPITQFWVANALRALEAYEKWLRQGVPDFLGVHKITIEALNAHFHVDKSSLGPLVLMVTIRGTYIQVNNTLLQSSSVFHSVDLATTKADFGRTNDPTFVGPIAYTMGRDDPKYPKHGIFFPPNFKTPRVGNQGYGPNCLAAVLLHECVHYVDINAPDYAYEQQQNPYYDTPLGQFIKGADYDKLPPELAIHNPSSYACFAAHVTKGRDKPRYGGGNPGL